MTKILVTYFSATGTTGMAATALADVAGADLYRSLRRFHIQMMT